MRGSKAEGSSLSSVNVSRGPTDVTPVPAEPSDIAEGRPIGAALSVSGVHVMLRVTDRVAIADWEITERFVRASGPGGQNVNKVATAVELRFEAARSPHLPPDAKARLKRLAGRRWTAEGAVLIESDRFRSQAMNRDDAREKLRALIEKALERPKPRRPTRPTLASKRRRLEAKSKRGAVKAMRREPGADE